MRNPGPDPRRRRVAVACAALGITAAAATSCSQVDDLLHITDSTSPEETADALEQLQILPSLEETKAQMQSAFDEIIAEAGHTIPGIVWEPATTIGYETACSPPYEQTGGSRYRFPSYQARVEIFQHDWDAFMTAAYPVSAKIGASDVDGWSREAPTSTPSPEELDSGVKVGPDDVTFTGPAHMVFTFRIEHSDGDTLWVGGATGCRLPGEAN